MALEKSIKVSIIIINYNYARYLPDSIDSSLEQSYNNVEVLVVDDGSTDKSREVIDQYGDSVIKMYKKNGGMMDAANHGFANSSGDMIIFLDADDYLFPQAAEKVISEWEYGISKVHFRLQKIDQDKRRVGTVPPIAKKLDQGSVWKEIVYSGDYVNVPTSGNVYSREALDRIFPVLDAKIGHTGTYFDMIPTDAYLKYRIPFFGKVQAIQECLGVYRLHGDNSGAGTSPYSGILKRRRKLRLVQMNMIFIEKQLKAKGIAWNSNILFNKRKIMKLRILSYRFDRKDHPWQDDSKASLISMYFKLLINDDLKKWPKIIFDIMVIMTTAYLPKKLIV